VPRAGDLPESRSRTGRIPPSRRPPGGGDSRRQRDGPPPAGAPARSGIGLHVGRRPPASSPRRAFSSTRDREGPGPAPGGWRGADAGQEDSRVAVDGGGCCPPRPVNVGDATGTRRRAGGWVGARARHAPPFRRLVGAWVAPRRAGPGRWVRVVLGVAASSGASAGARLA
jgi:hypothetical protein